MRGASAPGHSQIGKLPQGGDLLEHKSRTNKHGMQSGPFLLVRSSSCLSCTYFLLVLHLLQVVMGDPVLYPKDAF